MSGLLRIIISKPRARGIAPLHSYKGSRLPHKNTCTTRMEVQNKYFSLQKRGFTKTGIDIRIRRRDGLYPVIRLDWWAD